jgi:hypothetical protein
MHRGAGLEPSSRGGDSRFYSKPNGQQMALDFKVVWSELLIDRGKLDPLGVWRVGDRMISDLLAPFTTVVTQRPARYFSMYCWILDHLTRGPELDEKAFWRRFYVLEGIFLCAIQLHTRHLDAYYGGRIGSEHADALIRSGTDGQVDFSGLRTHAIRNGWETNYKNAMLLFYVVEVDFGVSARLKLTQRGKALADAYGRTIAETAFFRGYRDKSEVPLEVLRELGEVGCPCLLPALDSEREQTRRVLLEPSSSVFEHEERDDALWRSMFLILNFAQHQHAGEQSISGSAWRQMLTAGCSADGRRFHPAEPYADIARRWRIYAVDSLFIFALESGLRGFLEVLQSSGGLHVRDLPHTVGASQVTTALSHLEDDLELPLSTNLSALLEDLYSLEADERHRLEVYLSRRVQDDSSGADRMAWAYLLYLYAQSLYLAMQSDEAYVDAIDFYQGYAHWDGREISLEDTRSSIEPESTLATHFQTSFVRDWVISRQLQVRSRRRKEVAWFSLSDEFSSYDWEAPYHARLYRASRFHILLSFLHNLSVITYDGKRWQINESALAALGVE